MEGLALYTVYNNPSDYPGKFVVRRSVVNPGAVLHDACPLIVANTLEEARRGVPAGLVMLMPDEKDDEVIKEVWL